MLWFGAVEACVIFNLLRTIFLFALLIKEIFLAAFLLDVSWRCFCMDREESGCLHLQYLKLYLL